jgi:hypothetical protein
MSVEKIFEVELSVQDRFRLSIMPYEPYVQRAVDLILEFRELKRRWEIGSGEFHYFATASQEGCDLFVTTDEKHLLRPECRKAFGKYVRIVNPAEAVAQVT